MGAPSLQTMYEARRRLMSLPQTRTQKEYDYSIDLSTGSPAFASPKDVMAAVVTNLIKETRLLPPMQSYSRQEVPPTVYESYLAKANIMDTSHGLTKDNVVYGNGVTHLFSLAMKTLVKEQDSVMLPTPTYGHFAVYSGLTEEQMKFLPMRAEDEFKLTPEVLDTALKQREAEQPDGHIWLVMINPHNPTGKVYSQEEIDALADVLQKPEHARVNVIQDMVYKDTEYDKEKPAGSFAMRPDFAQKRVVTFLGPAKAFGLVGMRAGLAVGSEDFIKPMRDAIGKQQEFISLPSQLTTVFIYNQEIRQHGVYRDEESQSLEEYLKEIAAKYQARRSLWKDLIEGGGAQAGIPTVQMDAKTLRSAKAQIKKGVPGIKLLGEPESGFFQPLDFTAYKDKYYGEKKLETDSDLVEALWESQRVLALPGQCMFYPDDMLVLRTSFSLPPEKLVQAAKRMGNFVSKLKDEPSVLPEKTHGYSR